LGQEEKWFRGKVEDIEADWGGHARAWKAAGGGGHVSPNNAPGGGGHANYEGSAREDRIKVLYDDGEKKWFFLFFYSSVSKIASKILYVKEDRKWFFSPHAPPTHTLARSPPTSQNSSAQTRAFPRHVKVSDVCVERKR
jgi:hypothetical protein